MTVKVDRVYDDGTVLGYQAQHYIYGTVFDKYIALTNVAKIESIAADQHISVRGHRIGSFNAGDGIKLELYDCGSPKPVEVAPPTPEELAKRAKAQEIAAEQARQKRQAEQQKAQESLARALKLNQDSADKGEAYGLYRMGERYWKGEGVDKDAAKARDYLTQAAAAGNLSAKTLLETMEGKK